MHLGVKFVGDWLKIYSVEIFEAAAFIFFPSTAQLSRHQETEF